jgi:hypothetical protein
VPRSVADGGPIDSLIHVEPFISQRVASFRQLDCAVVWFGLRAAVNGAIAPGRWNGGERKRFDQLDVAYQPHDQPIEPHRDRQLVELLDRAGASGSVQ